MTAVDSGPLRRTSKTRRTGQGFALPALPGFLTVVVTVICLVPFLLVVEISFGQKIEGAAWDWAVTAENYRRFFVGAEWPEVTT